MLSTLPKLADRAFVLGFFLPTLMFAIATLLLFSSVNHIGDLLNALAAKDLGKGAYLLLLIWVGALLMVMLSHTWYQFLEGYTLPKWLQSRLLPGKQERLRKTIARLKKLHERWRVEQRRFPKTALQEYKDLQAERATWLPPKESDLLPTSFGNAIKAFETYPREIYGADGVSLWLRLSSVMSKEVAEAVRSSRTYVDFLINCMFFALLLAALGVARTLLTAPWQHISELGFFLEKIQYGWLIWTAGGIVAACFFYRAAVSQVPEWGALVIAAFDCYLPKLAEQLGYNLPDTAEEQQIFWTTFSQQVVYRRDPDEVLPFDIDRWKKPQRSRR